MRIRYSLAAQFVLLTFLSLSPGFADIGWFEDEVVEERQTSRKPNIQQLSRAFGHFIGQDISKQGIHLDVDAVVAGIRDGVAGKPAPMSEQQYDQIVSGFRQQHFQEVANFNLALADAFMASNGKKTDVVQTTPGKVQFVILERGQGPRVEPHSTPILRFAGRFIDGTVFTQTDGHQAIPVPLDDMIPGFRQGVIGMQEGEKRRIFIHPTAAYGTKGDLAPNSLLLFEVQVVKAGSPANVSSSFHQNARNQILQTSQVHDDWDLTLDDEDEPEAAYHHELSASVDDDDEDVEPQSGDHDGGQQEDEDLYESPHDEDLDHPAVSQPQGKLSNAFQPRR